MKSQTKLLVAAAVVALVAAVAWRTLERESLNADPAPRDVSRSSVERGTSDETLVDPEVERDREQVPGSGLEAAQPESGESAAVDPPEPEAVSIVRARIVDENGASVPGAVLRSIYVDGRPRGADCFDEADADGAVEIEIADPFMRAWKTEVFSMTFEASAPLRATVFTVASPEWHGVTDLGAIVLPRGGAVTGSVVDEAGLPIEGAAVVLAQAALARDAAVLRVSGPDPEVRRPRVLTDPSGRFVFAGAAVGSVRVLAGAPGKLWTITEPMEVQVDIATETGPLVLDPVPPEQLIAGIVLRPDGAPEPGARVSYEEKGGGVEGSLEADASGRFSYCPKNRDSVEFVARDPARGFGMSEPAVATRGTADLRLVLTPHRTLQIVVTSVEGTPLEGAAAMPLFTDGSQFAGGGRPIPGETWSRTDASGELELSLPPREFRFGVSLDGYIYQKFGPFMPSDAPERLVVELEREPRIAGRVLAYGQPVAGAEIEIGQRLENFVPLQYGFPTRFFSNQSHGIVSDADGSFACPVDADWTELVVLARTNDWATGEVELTVEPGAGASGVVIQVTRGGVLRGAVTPPAGRTAEGLVVAASRGDGKPLTTRVTADGTYRLERLTPGPWRVEPMLREPTGDVLSVAQTPEESDFRWNAEVKDGETTVLDLDARSLAAAELHGTLLIDGKPARGFTATIRLDELVQYQDDHAGAKLDSSGSFVLQAPNGKCKLTVSGELPDGHRIDVIRPMTFAGVRVDWTEDIELGALDETVDPGVGPVRLSRGNERRGDAEIIHVEPDGAGRIQCLAPVGTTSLQKQVMLDFGSVWQTLRSVEVQGR